MEKPARNTEYVAPGAPKSPLVVAIVSLITAALAILASAADIHLEVDQAALLAVVSGAVGVVAWWQNRAARAEQVEGVEKLKAAKAELPPGAVASDSMTEVLE